MAKRGRPPQFMGTKLDLGTNELQEKRRIDSTVEPLDLCLKRAFITENQHLSGIKLRWLHVLRHGKPTIQAHKWAPSSKSANSRLTYSVEEDEMWMAARGCEYNMLLNVLKETNSMTIVCNICIFHYRPKFLGLPDNKIPSNTLETLNGKARAEYVYFMIGMHSLEQICNKIYGKRYAIN